MLSSASDKAKLFVESFHKNSNLDDSGISLSVFPSRTNLKLDNISVTPKMVKKLIVNHDLSKASNPDCIPMVVQKNCELELSYILAEFFKCLKESCFPDCWKVSSVIPVFTNLGKRSTAKKPCPVSVLSVVSKIFKKLVNNRIVDHLETCGFFSSRSTANLLTVVSDELLWLLIGLMLLKLWHLIYSRLLTGFGMLVFFTNLSSMQFQVRYLALFLFSVMDGFEWFWMEGLHNNIQLMLEFFKALFLVLHFSRYKLMNF